MTRVDGQVVDMLRFRVERFPCAASVFRHIYATATVRALALVSPCSEIQSVLVARVEREAGGAVDSLGKGHAFPVLGSICRSIERPRAIRRRGFTFASPGDDQVEGSVGRA